MVSDTYNSIAWELDATNGTPQFVLNADTVTMDCTDAGLYVVCLEFALDWSLTALAPPFYAVALLALTISSGESLGNWLFAQCNATIDPTVALNDGYYVADYTTPPFAATTGDSINVRQEVNGALAAGVDPLCGGALSIARVG